MKQKLKQQALDMVSRGWVIFPVGGDDGKKPLVKWSRINKVRENEINVWLHTLPVTGWGVVTGEKSGLVVVDVDGSHTPREVEQAPTYTVATPSGGWHFYYAYGGNDIVNSASKIAEKVDIRGQGGYVVAAGRRPDGREYESIGGAVATLPEELAERIRAPKKALTLVPVPQAPLTGSDVALGAAERYAARCKPSVSGNGGHNQALRVARAMVQGFGLSADAALQAMAGWNASCQPPWSEKELRHKIDDAQATPDPQGRPIGYLLERRAEVVVLDELVEPPKLEPTKPDHQADDEEREELCRLLAEQGTTARQFIGYVRGKARIWQPGLATGAALALGATMAGRRWHWQGVTSHLYILGVAGSACGKDAPMKCLMQCLGEDVIAGMPSVKALRDALDDASMRGRGACLISGEIAKLLRQILGQRAPAYLALASQLLLELGTWGTETMRFERAASDRGDGQRQQAIKAPCLSIYGTATPEDLLDVLGEATLRDGLLGRFLFFKAQHRLPDKHQPSIARGNPAIAATLADVFRERQIWVEESDPVEGPGEPMAMEGTAGQILSDYDQEIHRARQIGQCELPDELLGRQAEHAMRVAIAVAGLSDFRVTETAERLAVRIVDRCALDLWRLASCYGSSSPWEKGLRRVEQAIRELARPDGFVHRRDIIRRVRDRDVQLWIDALVDEGRLNSTERKARNGHKITAYRLA